MRVALNVEQLLTPSPGGVGRYAAKLAVHLSALGVDVVPVVARHSDAEVNAAWSSAGVEALAAPHRLALPRPLLYDAWHLLAWPPVVGAGENVDVIHAPSLAVPPKRGTPLVVSIHDAAPWRHPEAFTARGRWFHRMGLRAAGRRADCVLTGTEAAADEIAELAAFPRERLRVVPYGVDSPATELSAAQVQAVLRRYGLDGATYVLWVGSLEPRKGVGTLVAAMARLAAGGQPTGEGQPTAEGQPGGHGRRAGVELVLAGFAGWQNTDLLGTEDVAALGPALHRVGRVSDADLQALYAGAAVFAFPSVHEGFGLPVLEAMAAGVPVVASDIPPVRQVCGGAALLVPPGDVHGWSAALVELLGDPVRRAGLALAGWRRAGQFSWAATAAATLEVYRELVG